MCEEYECAICLDYIEHGTSVTKDDAFCNCTHIFCQKCVVKFVQNKKISEIFCPLCRMPCRGKESKLCSIN